LYLELKDLKMKGSKKPEDERGGYALVSRIEERGEENDGDSRVDEAEEAEDLYPGGQDDKEEDDERRLVRKIDRRIMPCLILMIILNYLDRNALANARIQGIEDSLHLNGSQFNTAIAVFFIGYIGLQVPSNLILTRVRPSIYLPGCMIAWGILSASTAFVSGFSSLVLIRFLLGIVEAPFFPGALFLLSAWYTKRELAFRTSLLYSGSLLAGAFGGLVGAGIESTLSNVLGWRSWQWLFVLESTATIALAVAAMFILPDYPHTTQWLTESERNLAMTRGYQASGNRHSLRKGGLLNGLKLALVDYKLYLLSAIILAKTSAGAVTSFIPTLIATFDLPPVSTLLLIAPPYICAAIAGLLVSYSSDKHSERAYHIIGPISFGLLGFALFGLTLLPIFRYLSLFLMLAGVYGSYNVALAWISSTIPAPAEKRSAAIAIINVSGNIAQIYSPYLYLRENGPRYTSAMIANCGFCLVCIGIVLWLRKCLKRENNRLDADRSLDRGTYDDFRYSI
jgi:MFS family permease